MIHSFSDATTHSLSLAVIRFTLVLSIAWLMHYGGRRLNPRWRIATWRCSVVCAFVALLLCTQVRGWGPELFRPLAASDLQMLMAPVAHPAAPGSGDRATHRADNGGRDHAATADQPSAEAESRDNRMPAQSAAAAGAMLAWIPTVWQVCLLIYGLVVASSLAGLFVQWAALRKMMRNAQPAGERLLTVLAAAAEQAGLRSQPRLLLCDSVDIPFATGVRNPTILLPRSMAEDYSTGDLNMVLTHECGHFAGRDIVWALAIQLLRIVAWPHPLCWAVADAHRFACDVRCDQLASKNCQANYSAVLARCALKVQSPVCAGIAMAFVQQSETLKRIRLIQSGAGRGPSSRSGRIVGLLLGGVTLLAAATFGVNQFVVGMIGADADQISYVDMKVVAKNGQPVAGAEIVVDGLRAKKEPASGYGNPQRAKTATTDAEGSARVPYPKYVHERLETGAIVFRVTHPDFILFESQGLPVDAPIEVTLEEGRRVEMSVVGPDGPFSSDEVYVLQPARQPSQWRGEGEGALRSPPLAPSESPLMLVGRAKESLLFSDLIRLTKFPAGDCDIGEVRLAPGRTLRGKLSDQVPRPVLHGKVGLTVAASDKAAGASYDDSLFWYDVVDVQEDGSFEFASVPRDVEVQLLAGCDGWVSVSAPPAEILQRFPYVTTDDHAKRMHDTIVIAQRFSPDVTSVVVEMEPAADCEFLVVDQQGAPISDAQIHLSPNTAVSPGPGAIFGIYSDSKSILDNNPNDPADQERAAASMRAAMSRNSATTDAEGKATIRNLPRKSQIGIGVYHADYELPIGSENRFHRTTRVDLSAGSTQMTIKLQKAGTQFLGE